MIILSIIGFITNDNRICLPESGETAILIVFMLINPFTYNFFNPVLEYFICPEL